MNSPFLCHDTFRAMFKHHTYNMFAALRGFDIDNHKHIARCLVIIYLYNPFLFLITFQSCLKEVLADVQDFSVY